MNINNLHVNSISFRNILLYMMSGTGNTFRVAKWMKEIAESHTVSTEIIMIDQIRHKDEIKPDKEILFGVMFPAHGLMAPWSMIKFLFHMRAGNNAPVVIISTRGDIKLRTVVIPGTVCFWNFLAAIILLLKKYRVKGMFSLDMPVNIINFHWGINTKNIEIMLIRARSKIGPVMDRFLKAQNVFYIPIFVEALKEKGV